MTALRPARRRAPGGGRPARVPGVAVAVAVCLAIAVGSVLAVPTVPLYDEFTWLVWGRELAHHLVGAPQPFVLAGGPSWKPLPVAVTAVLSLSGPAAVTLWIVVVRTVGLLGLWLAYRLGSRLGADRRWPAAGPVGGVLGAIAVALMLGWFGFMLGATSEPLAITAALLWVECAPAGRRAAALAAGVSLALIRPEAGVLVAGYGAWLAWRGRTGASRALIAAAVAMVPLAWIVPPWLAGGSPLQAATQSRQGGENVGTDVATIALTRAEHVLVGPVLIAALALVGLAARRRERTAIGLALVSVAYLAVIEAMTLHGFPGLQRFMLPAAALVSVLAGAGVARIAALAGGGPRSLVVALALLALGAPQCLPRITRLGYERRAAAVAMRGHDSLVSAVVRAGGRRAVLPCATSAAAVNWREDPMLAWILDVPLTRIGPVPSRATVIDRPGVAFLASRLPALGNPPTVLAPELRARSLWHDGPWLVMRVTRLGDARADHCAGS